MRLVLATRNDHKVQELAVLLPGVELVAMPAHLPSPEETGETFEANALIKARAAAGALGVACIADDSGLEVAELGGVPGVRSARWAGEDATDADNLAKLMSDAPAGARLAYVCVIALVDPVAGREWTVRGRCTGTLDAHPRGTGGFGYDPAFLPDDVVGTPARTMAELAPTEKASISHRGRAAAAFLARLGAAR